MNVPQLPGATHLVTLAYLLVIVALVALVIWIWLRVRQAQEG